LAGLSRDLGLKLGARAPNLASHAVLVPQLVAEPRERRVRPALLKRLEMGATVVFATVGEQRQHRPKIGQVVNGAAGGVAFAGWRGVENALVET
jgi:hypothetical protein